MKHRAISRTALLLVAMWAAITLGDSGVPEGVSQDPGLRTEGQSTQPQATIRALPRPKRVNAGEVFTIEVSAHRGRGAAAAAFHLVYDPLLVEPVPSDFREGGWLKQGRSPTSFLARTASTGDRVLVGVTRLGAPRGVRKDGTVCRLSFRALAPGATAIVFDRAHLTSAGGSELNARFLPARLTIRAAPAGKGP